MKGLNNCDNTGREYSLAPIDDPIRFWRSKELKQAVEIKFYLNSISHELLEQSG